MKLLGREVDNFDAESDEDKKICNHVKQLIEQSRSSASRISHEAIWMTNIAYVLGYDGVVFNTNTRSFQPVNRGAPYVRRNRLHINKILPTVNNRLAKLCKNKPRFDIPPESNTQEDKDAATLGLQILDVMWSKLSMEEKRINLMMWVQQCGHGYIQVGWDPMSGKLMQDPRDPGSWDFEGDVFSEIFPAFEGFPNPYAKTFEDVCKSWFIRAKARPLEYFKQMYPEKGHLVKEEGVWLMSAQYENRISGMNNRGPGSGGTSENAKNCAIEMIKWEAPTREHPKGRVIICANGIKLKDEDLPDELNGMIPIAKFDDLPVAGKFFPESIVTHLRPVQDQLNDTLRRRAEWAKKFIAGKYSAAKGSGLILEALNDSSSEVVYYDPVPNAPAGPQAIQVPAIPQFAYMEEERLDAKFNEISGISEVSKGNIPSASIPAVGMQLLIEADDTRIGVTTEQHEHAFARAATLILRFVEAGYTMPRKIKMGTQAAQYNVIDFLGKDLKGNTEVRVVRGSLLPGSKTLKRQEILNAYTQGLLGDPADPRVREKVLGMIEFGDVADLWEDLTLDKSQIKKGVEALEQGQEVEASRYDNNALWVYEINKIRKSDKFQGYSPQIQELFINELLERTDMIVDASSPPSPPPPPPPGIEDIQAMSQEGMNNGLEPEIA